MKRETNYTNRNFFGSYILNTHTIYGYEAANAERDKKREKEIFEVIDDYIEQA